MTDDMHKIEMKLVEANYLTRWPCTVCGGYTEKVPVLCEGGEIETDARGIVGPGMSRDAIRVCEFCLEAGDVDGRLQRHADSLDRYANYVRGLVGRLKVPSYADWKAAYDDHEEKWVRANTEFKTVAEYDAHLKKRDYGEGEMVGTPPDDNLPF
jgi:hypothetical protein